MAEQHKVHRVGIAMNGVTGRMGMNQHLFRSIVAIREQGGVHVSDTETIIPEPILIGRNPVKLEELSKRSGIERWTTDVDEALGTDGVDIYFDAQTTDRRVDAVT